MFQRFLMCSTLILLVWLPSPARAQEKEVPLTVRVQIRSLDTLIDNIKLLVSLAGQDNIANQVDQLIKTKLGPKGFEGIDPKRPIGFYSRFGSKDLNHADVNGVLLVPIADEDAFLNLLTNLNFKAEKNAQSGIYKVKTSKDGTTPNVLFRFVDKYAYVSILNVEALETKNLLTPKQVFSAKQTSAISASLRLDQIPKEVKDIFKVQFEQSVQSQKAPPNEDPVQKAARLEAQHILTEVIFSVVNEGKQLGIDIDVDKKSKEMSFELSLTAKDGSALAKSIAGLGKAKSLFSSLSSKNPAVHASVTLTLPKNLQALVADGLAEAQKKALGDIKDAEKRKQAEELFQAIAPTLKAAEHEAAVTLQGPDKNNHYSGVVAVKVLDGENLSKTVHKILEETIKNLPAQSRELIALDVETVSGTAIHRFEVSKFYDEKAKSILGESPVYLALHKDALFFAVGPEGLSILKTSLRYMKESTASPVALEVSMARLLPLLPEEVKKKAAGTLSLKPGETGTIRFTIEGGESLRVRLNTQPVGREVYRGVDQQQEVIGQTHSHAAG